MKRPLLDINIVGAHLGIWQDNANDPSFREEIFLPLLAGLKRRGWKVTADPAVLKHHRCISPSHRLAARGDLRTSISIHGRTITVEFWSEAATNANHHGRRYDFDKLSRMPYLDRQRVVLERQRIIGWLETLASVKVSRDKDARLSPMARIATNYAESWHTDKKLGRPICNYDYNRQSKDGLLIEHDSTVWFIGRKGRIGRGRAFYNINSMWWVVAGSELHNLSSREIFCRPPANLRLKLNDRARRARLEGLLASATRRMEFSRAQTLKSILFGEQNLFLLWSRKNEAYYGANYCSYTTDVISAGKYTRAEAEAEVRRVPHILEAVGLDGERFSFGAEGDGAKAA